MGKREPHSLGSVRTSVWTFYPDPCKNSHYNSEPDTSDNTALHAKAT